MKELLQKLESGVIILCFRKLEGPERCMVCTTNPRYIPGSPKVGKQSPESNTFGMYALDVCAWRDVLKSTILHWREAPVTDDGYVNTSNSGEIPTWLKVTIN